MPIRDGQRSERTGRTYSTKPLRRAYVRAETRQGIENSDAYVKGKTDIGHRYGYEHASLKKSCEKIHMDQKDFNNLTNDPDLFVYQDKSQNRSHADECKDSKTQRHNAFRLIREYYGKEKDGQTRDRSNESAKVQAQSHTAKQSHGKSGETGGSHGAVSGIGSHGSTSGGHGNSGGGHGGSSGGHGSASGGHGGSSGGGHGGSSGGHGGSSGGHGGSSGGH